MESEGKGWHYGSLFFYTACAVALFSPRVTGQIRYSIPEEMAEGSFVGNIASDLGLKPNRLISGKARVFTADSSEYIGLDKENGHLVVKNKIDREELCGEISACSVSFDVIFENPMELYRVTVDIQDINDNSPVFPKSKIEQEISELAVLGARFPLESAIDPDVGVNTLQKYTLQPTDHFKLNVQIGGGGNKNIEMVLHSPLDRENKKLHKLILTALDGGKPQRSATVQINIIVLDGNDNAPVFSQSSYKTSVVENAPKSSIVTRVSATDADESSHGIQYYFEHASSTVKALFSIDADSGEVKVIGDIDYEKHKQFTVKVKAKDHGGLTDSSEIIIDVIDVNDNTPKITIMSFASAVSEDASPGTVIAMINIQDLDSGDNSKITCSIDLNSPFKIISSLTNYYNLVTYSELDREQSAEYNITITAVDGGNPPLSSKDIFNLKISDVNDHTPQFEQESYNAFIAENNPPSTTILTVKAVDMDWGPNAKVSYFLIDGDLNGAPLASYISINSESGVIYAEKSFDYEQLKSFKMQVKAQDGGSPPLSNNMTVNIIIQDQNDNAPQVLYPVQTGASVVAEIVPRAADVGYLVTKVVAVDVDSGQNAWLSYKLQKATDRALFEVGLQNGEIRTVRQVTDKDAVKQKLTVVVEDNGQPSRSAVVSINVAVADSFPEVLSEFTDFTHEKQYDENLTFYLILALAVVSLLFIVSIISIISVKIYRWRQNKLFYKSGATLPVIPYYPPVYADGTLQHVYNYEMCGTTDSRMSDMKFVRPYSQNTLVSQSRMGTVQREKKQEVDDLTLEQNPPNADWRFSPNQRPGPSGQHRFHTLQQRWTPYEKSRAGARPDEADASAGVIAGTRPWPNPPTEAEQFQALIAAANEVSEATATLGPRYNPQYGPDYRQNVYIPGSTATLTANPQQQVPQQALPPPQALPPVEAPKAAQTPASKKKPTKKDKK
ncbi:protocadherin gamma-A5-like isoform X5 [Sinocyclocheilus anshuiensis]|uniref:protocadherin gamma-A5-like isoform X5 n=1 Tax=Sinocyclocheilus anshuiensis TaxID=1608454 RepID=UPI0007B96253|nr:PREDICTED: protocadherin gamma-A5-like isoform X5 [Sinocyclocheilus anshuiensis]